ncbi:MAG: cyclic peptide export ABC transporter [Desulfobacteraceae bacterium]|nr:cyclic peptide export ABC transporter [Desulfobacteraceae bacterium]
MYFIRFLWSVSEKTGLYVITLSVINGISGGLLVILFPNAAIDFFSGNLHVLYFVALPATAAVYVVSKHLSQRSTDSAIQGAVEKMILEITNTVRHEELPEFEQRSRSDIHMSVVNAQSISFAAVRGIEAFQTNISLVTGWIYILLFISWGFGILLLILRLISHMINETIEKIVMSFSIEQMQQETGLFKAFQNHLFGFKELKFNSKKDKDMFENYLLVLMEKNKETRVRKMRYSTEFITINLLIFFLTMLCCICFFSAYLSSDNVFKIIIILIYATQLDILIGSSMPHVMEGTAALEHLHRIFDADSLKQADQDIWDTSWDVVRDFDFITMDDIRFTYPGETDFTVEIEQLKIMAGEILFITGGNGSGKSTLINMLTGLYSPDAGMIKIDDLPVRMTDYRNLFSAVFADFHLFDRLYGIDTVDGHQVRELLKLTDLDRKTSYGESGFSTLDLSSGQQKRLALVIAMLEDKPVFVFDEWAASQDPHFRHYFYETMLPSFKEKGKTIIAITHDDRYFHLADQVIRMEYGSILERWRPGSEKPKSVHPLFSHRDLSTPGEKEYQTREHISRPTGETGHESKKQAEKQNHKGLAGQLRKIFQEERTSLQFIGIFMFLFSVSFIGLIVILMHMSNSVSGPETVQYILFIIFLVLLVTSVRRSNLIFNRLVEKRIAALRQDVMKHIRKTDLRTLEQIGAGKIYTALTSDIREIATASTTMMYSYQGITRMAMIYVYIGFLNISVLAMMLILTAVAAFFYISNHVTLIQKLDQARHQEAKLFESVSHLLEGFKELRLNSRKSDDFYHNSLRHHASRLRELKTDSAHCYANNTTVTYTFWMVILLVLTLVLPFLGVPASIIPVAVALVIMLPLRQIIDRYSQFHMAHLSLKRLNEFEEEIKSLSVEVSETAGFEEPIPYTSVRYDSIAFSYDGANGCSFSLGPLNLWFKTGEIVFITGGNGSGKSTLLKLITGLYPLDSGCIYLNNEHEIDIGAYRELFSVIFTDFYLFDRLYGMEKIDETKLGNLLERFRLEKRVKWTDGKFSTLDLSTGQKKRLAMLVAIMEDKPVYVFDEWAADQDPHFRDYFYNTMLPEFKSQGKTVIAVTHDDRYFHTADRVLKLDYGQLAEF